MSDLQSKITRCIKKLENMSHNEENDHSIETNQYMTRSQRVIETIFRMFKKVEEHLSMLSRDMEHV